MIAEVSDSTLTNREEIREAWTVMEIPVLLVIIGDNDRDVQALVVFYR
jgi:hypothetical protein